MKRKIFLDIETLPPAEEVQDALAHEICLAQAPKKELALTGELDELNVQQFRELALHGEHGRVLAIGMLVEEDSRVVHHGLLGRERATGKFHLDEVQTLKAFWHLVEGFNVNRDLFIGHNIMDFDLPFLIKRSVIHRVKPSITLSFRRYQRQPIFDTMWEWSCWRHRIKLHDLAVALQINSSKQEGIDGSRIYDAFLNDRHSDIALYCMRDVECAREAYYRLEFLEAPALVPYASKVKDAPYPLPLDQDIHPILLPVSVA
ncbi:MAG TPA: hypothetical protein VF543_22000 [Pyrinomonadaceae bacterium]|jgi:hypothetical protein